MTETNFNVGPFLRIVSLRPNQAISELKARKFRSGTGGPPTLVAIRNAMREVFYDGVDPENALRALLAKTPDRQASHLTTIFRRFCRIVAASSIQPAACPHEASLQGRLGVIGIKVAPEIAYFRGGVHYEVNHWTTRSVDLESHVRRLGYRLMAQGQQELGRSGAVSAIQDLVDPRFGSAREAAGLDWDRALDVIEILEDIWINLEEDTRPMHYAQEHGITSIL